MNTFKITYADGNVTITSMNATLHEATIYYTGTSFNFGDIEAHPQDKMVKVVSVKQIINNLFVTQKDLFSDYNIYDENGTWLNAYRDMIDVDRFCNNIFVWQVQQQLHHRQVQQQLHHRQVQQQLHHRQVQQQHQL